MIIHFRPEDDPYYTQKTKQDTKNLPQVIKKETKDIVKQEVKKETPKAGNPFARLSTKVKAGLISTLFIVPTGVAVHNCSNQNKQNNIAIVDKPVDTSMREKYLDIGKRKFYVIKAGDNLGKIAEEHNVSVQRLMKENGMNEKSVIHASDKIIIPETYKVKNIKSIDDVAKLTGLRKEFLNELTDMEGCHNKIYRDVNGYPTIGRGHLVTKEEMPKYVGRTLSDSEILTIFAQDIVDRDLNLKTMINEKAYNSMPARVKESVLDIIFNKGERAVEENEKLLDGLNRKDYVKAIVNMNQDYSYVKNDKTGKLEKRFIGGLCKRRLYDMQNASKIFKNGIPDEIIQSAKKVYNNGLYCLAKEAKAGAISKEAYPNILKEYKALAYTWFDKKFGEYSDILVKSNQKNVLKPVDNRKIMINGKPSNYTVETLYEEWQKNAKSQSRFRPRPIPIIDANGVPVADIKILEPLRKGVLSGQTIIVNPGHGGMMVGKGKNNLNFDPGTSNAMMDKAKPNIETNKFIGNNGKALEEWAVNSDIADILTNKIRMMGAKVIRIQGSVYTAQNAIKKYAPHSSLIVSLHSNSANDRGIYIIGNAKGGVDKEDAAFAKTIADRLNQHSWFKGITHTKAQRLGVLSTSANSSLPQPGILIETGNLKHETDVANLNSIKFRTTLVESIIDGMTDFLKHAKKLR